ncbi:hypothetical protein [Streptomyces sp. NPDC048650]|uniref:hypothetical protein n=1 Tax=unclassified Streptomyces TaxID=2593676 RepID=UPI003714F881
MAPGFRSRITTGLLVAAAALPVSLATTTATAAELRITRFDLPPHLVHRHTLPDSYAEDPSLAGIRAGEGRGHPGRPELLEDLPGAPRPPTDLDSPDFPDLRDFLADIPDEVPHYPDDPSEYLPWHDRQYRSDPDSPDSSTEPDADADSDAAADADADVSDDAPAPEDPATNAPESRPDGARRPKGAAPATPPPAPSRSAPAKPAPSPRSDVAGRLGRHPYKPLQPPAKPRNQHHTPADDTDADPVASANPYALEGPTAPVERVLPMGAGLALTGLGLAFLGLRLRRR